MELHEFDVDSNSMTNNISIAAALNIKDVKVVEEEVIERNFECQECGKKLKSQRVLDQHFRQFHQPWTHNQFCHLCSYTTYEKAVLKTHLGTQHNIGQYKCKDCSFECTGEKKFRKHRTLVHLDTATRSKRRWKCTECDSGFRIRKQLAEHMWKEHAIVFKYDKKRLKE